MKKGKMSLILLAALLLLCVIATHTGAQSFDLRKVTDPSRFFCCFAVGTADLSETQ